MATLVTIPFSHYCEKARWALDYTGYDYVEEGHVPVLHRIAVKHARRSCTSVPVLVTPERVFSDSREILDHADSLARPERKLYPEDVADRAAVKALANDYDERLGPHIRRVLYFHLLPHRRMALELMAPGTPPWERVTAQVLFPVLRIGMRRFMQIDAERAIQSRDMVLRVFDDVERRLAEDRSYLAGPRFTAADLTFAALASTTVMPAGHAIAFPPRDEMPPALVELTRETQTRPVGAFVRRVYAAHRGREQEQAG